MAPNYASLHQKLIQAITAAAPKGTNPARREFIAAFYASSTVADLKELEAKHAATIALTAEAFFATRVAGTPKISISETIVVEQGRSYSRTRIMLINDDMPFLVDSISALCTALGLTIHRILHPILAATRDAKGTRKSGGGSTHESLIYLELSPLPSTVTAKSLEAKLRHALAHVTAAVADWRAMRDHTRSLTDHYAAAQPGISAIEALEIRDLLIWLAENHFVFLGMADYRAKGDALVLDEKTARGIYRVAATNHPIERATVPTSTDLITILKASDFSLVHRRVPMDYVVLRRLDKNGKFMGETRILGLFTSTVYYRETQQIPFIRRKSANIIARAGFERSSHSGKALKTTLEFFPRDELFQIDEERLFQTAMGIVSLDAKPQVRLFVRTDTFERFASAMVYIPRERFSSELREEIVRILERAYGGKLNTFFTQLTDSPLARLHIHIETTPGNIPEVDEAALEQQISSRASLWADALRDAVIATHGANVGETWAQSFANAFPASYINGNSAASAAYDIQRMVECIAGDGLALELFRGLDNEPNQLYLNCFTRDLQSELSSIIPLLEHMGCTVLDATPYIISPLAPLPKVLLRRFTLRVMGCESLSLNDHKTRIQEAIALVWRGVTDDDALNALVFSAGLSARDVEILRAYSRYLQQLDFPYSQSFIAAALNNHAGIAAALVAFFHARFDPALTQKTRDSKSAALKTHIEAALENVTNLGEDRIIRQFLALMLASLRTNFYQRMKGAPKTYLSLKFRSNLVPEMKLPVPYAEIFVTSTRIEGIHLRGGPVARGGLRWSDRPEDFRTEVLGLMKTQMVKNAVIVPVGSKGGFVLRHAPSERDALQAEGIACYQTFLRGLLDITDNIVNKKIVPPADVVRYDNDDPYLVVAADKGTATFSDIANGISAEYGFWLSDAFASGGSVGYDHKVMGITARGGWVSVERHFREMGHDISKETFTCVGIGDMAGDVFGNGMLLSNKLRLVAAFNHRHIFIDPTPDAAKTFVERERLFKLPRSNWTDYNAKLISKGGGIFERSAKSIPLSDEARKALGTEVKQATPDELIRIILKAPVDLLWNGGIGTYVKAISETHEQVGDRANNSLRINGGELRAKIIGEGGNLGFTQRGRIEYAKTGGRINTDAIDNSAGVDCSDHEVNIKIGMSAAVASKRITIKQRDAVLKKMTDEVGELVLVDNRLQTQAISIAQLQGVHLLEPAAQLMQHLEADGFLNRAVEFLPDAKQLAELRSAKQGLSRPELAVLLAYAKMAFFRDLAEESCLDAPYFEGDLLRYFPVAMQKGFASEIKSHRLRREIVATMITNSIVNRTGFAFAHDLMQATGLGAGVVAQAYVITRDAFGLRDVWKSIEALDGKISANVQSQLFVRVNHFIDHSCRWLLQNVPQSVDVATIMKRYEPGIREVEKNANQCMTGSARTAFAKAVSELTTNGVGESLAKRIAMLDILTSAGDMVDVANVSKQPITSVGRLYFELGDALKLGWLRDVASHLTAENYWQQLAVKSLVVEFYQAQRRLSLGVIHAFGKQAHASSAWQKAHAAELGRYESFIADLRAQPTLDYPMLIVALRQVQAITSL